MTFELNNGILWDGTEQQLKDFFKDRFQEWDPATSNVILTDGQIYWLDTNQQNIISIDGSWINVLMCPVGTIREVELPEAVTLEQTAQPTELTDLDDRLLSLVEDGFRTLVKKV